MLWPTELNKKVHVEKKITIMNNLGQCSDSVDGNKILMVAIRHNINVA